MKELKMKGEREEGRPFEKAAAIGFKMATDHVCRCEASMMAISKGPHSI
jgi:hypothetical protein